MKKPKFPQFDSYVCEGDYIEWEVDGYQLTARILYDTISTVNDSECYSAVKINQWRNNEWWFCGVVISVSFNDVLLDDHASSLWGIECNYNARGNKYLSEVAKKLEEEALEVARESRQSIIKQLMPA